MAVVTSAITTIMVNSGGSRTPSPTPASTTMSPVRPRVFISTPSVPASRQDIPPARAGPAAPRILPAQATAITAASSR